MNAVVCFRSKEKGCVVVHHLPDTKDLPKQIEKIENDHHLTHYATYLREKK